MNGHRWEGMASSFAEGAWKLVGGKIHHAWSHLAVSLQEILQ